MSVLQSTRIWGLRAAGALSVCMLAGCPGRISDPEPFLTPRCTLPIRAYDELIVARCGFSGCHGAVRSAAGLDLVSPGVAARLVQHAATQCAGKTLVSARDSNESYLVDKLRSAPACGDSMPVGGPAFTSAEIECVAAWTVSLSVDAGTPSDGAVDASDGDVTEGDAP